MSERMTRIARKQARDAAAVVSHDERITRERVWATEKQIGALIDNAEKTERLAVRLSGVLLERPFWGRLRWLVLGR